METSTHNSVEIVAVLRLIFIENQISSDRSASGRYRRPPINTARIALLMKKIINSATAILITEKTSVFFVFLIYYPLGIIYMLA